MDERPWKPRFIALSIRSYSILFFTSPPWIRLWRARNTSESKPHPKQHNAPHTTSPSTTATRSPDPRASNPHHQPEGTLLLIQRPTGPPIYLFWPQRMARYRRRKQCVALLATAFPAWSKWEQHLWARRLSVSSVRWAWILPDGWIELRPIDTWSKEMIRTIHCESLRLQTVIARTSAMTFRDSLKP